MTRPTLTKLEAIFRIEISKDQKTATVVEKTDFWSATDLNKAEMLALSQEIQELAEAMRE